MYATPCPVLFSELNKALFKYTERKNKQRVNFLSDFIIFFESIFQYLSKIKKKSKSHLLLDCNS